MSPRNLAAIVLAAFIVAPAHAAEGMWTFEPGLPARIKAGIGADVDQAFIDRIRAASVRLSSGCSASVVSGQGLVATNHHCVRGCAEDLSSGRRDYARDGFLTDRREDEKTCPGLRAEVLLSIEDITDKVAAATKGLADAAFVRARDAAMAEAEKACGEDEALRCQAIGFYGGARFKLHRYRVYRDVRLVFAPETAVGYFGGDPDNFNFPRYNLDAGFLRLYEAGRPAATPDHLAWSDQAPAEGAATFVSGNPGSTERLRTVAELITLRDLTLPIGQLQRAELRGRLIQYAEKGGEARREAVSRLFGLENGYKSIFGRQMALAEPGFIAARQAAESDLRAKVAADPQLAARLGDPWAEIERVQQVYRDRFLTFRQLEQNAGGGSSLYAYALTIVRAAREREKPSAERQGAYADSRLARMRERLVEAEPISTEMERLLLEFWLSKTREALTVDAPQVKALLGRDSPEGLAARLVRTRLASPAVRAALWDGGLKAVLASDDPMIRFALVTEELGAAERDAWNAAVTAPMERASARVADARFAVYGESVYPDANFSLRLSFGKVLGWTERGQAIAPFTTYAGLWSRATGADPYALPPRWLAAKDRVDPDLALNFVTDNDIVGGNSGSPVIDIKGRVVGLAFDGNLPSLGNAYGFDAAKSRTVVVAAPAVTEALSKVYGRAALVAELSGS